MGTVLDNEPFKMRDLKCYILTILFILKLIYRKLKILNFHSPQIDMVSKQACFDPSFCS